MLLNLAVLLALIEADRDAALLAGAVLAASDRHPNPAPYTKRLQQELARSRSRLGTSQTAAAAADGAALTHIAAVAHARRAIRSARQ